MANGKATASFFENGTTAQFEYCFKLYPQVLKLKAEKRCKKPQELIRLDQWYQNELPKLIKARGKDAHMVYDELVQTMKWKQSRGKFYPQLSYLVKVNTPRAVVQETKKAFRKLPNLEQAITALSNLKGVGTTMASALLAAAAPDSAPFMADECLMAIPEIEGIDYTTKEYLNFVQHIQSTVQRLNVEVGGEIPKWSPHRVELALWSHYVANDLSPELLDDMPGPGSGPSATNGSISAVDGDIDEKALDGEDTNDGDDESLGVVGRNIATESENENENTNPASLTAVATSVAASGEAAVGVLQDGDSNFVSNDSTSQEPIIDENTTLTTATTSTDDGEAISTPLASDSESNIEAPLKANHNTTATASAQLMAPSQAKAQTPTQVQVLGSSKVTIDNGTTGLLSANAANNANASIVRSTGAITATEAVVTPITAANGNGNGAVSNANSDGENSSCVLRSSSVNDDENASDADLDDDDDDADGDDDDEEVDESSNSHGCVGSKTQASVPNIISDNNDSTLSSSGGTALTSPTIGQKRTALHCGVDAGGGIGTEAGAPPELKKLRTD